SNLALVVAIVLYVLPLIVFSADLSSTSQRRSDARLAALDAQEETRVLQTATVASEGAAPVSVERGTSGPDGPLAAAEGTGVHAPGAMTAQKFAFILSIGATLLHVLGVLAR